MEFQNRLANKFDTKLFVAKKIQSKLSKLNLKKDLSGIRGQMNEEKR